MHMLGAQGTTVLRPPEGEPRVDLDLVLENENRMAEVVRSVERNGVETVPGFQVLPGSFAWFSIVLARTEAAMLAAFTGGGKPTAQYLTNEQGRRHVQRAVPAKTGKLRDTEHPIHGLEFMGTDHIFRLNGVRVETFSGLEKSL
ncbi:hypothetical protein [Streptomyces iconiensis]|uniref:Uncharacterized protein n=1 Tax=Streptomyces iconiensis TaxID=1384038 RepID=A0ABT6ZR17_9ACTN|nr:hypothetical protein [Streptomyces iconiensis]MDJ1131507.1 hypothetical protein [Streptomyces iconiensis]